METAGARALHDRAQGVAASLQLLAPDAGAAAAAPLLLELAELTWQLREAAAALADGPSRGIWEQRAAWLGEETRKLAAARAGSDGELLAEVLDAAARQCRAAEAARSAAEAAQRSAELPIEPPTALSPGPPEPSPRGALAVLQVRTELMLANEQLARRTADSSQLSADVVSLSEARAAAAAEAASLRSELETVRKERARQSGVIEALMRRSEELCADAGRARELEASNEALARGLEAQGGTLDRLLALNEELAGVANALSAAREAGGAPAGEAPAGAAPEPLYEEEWELEEAEARARGEPPPKGWLMRAWGAATMEQPSGAADAGEAKAAPAAEADAV